MDSALAPTLNPCKADLVRRQRAVHDGTLVDRMGPMERHISFEVGYDHRAFPEACGGGGHGQHGMSMTFILLGPSGATQWRCNMPNWVPGNVRLGNVDAGHPVALVPTNSRIGDVYAADLGYHSPTPQWEGQEQYGRDDCHLLPDGTCFYDGSGLNAEPVLEAFLNHGPMAVWAALATYYAELFGTPAAAAPPRELMP